MQLVEANKPVARKGQLESDYAARSTNPKDASKALKDTLRQYGK
jgi:hypothetical protein